MSAQSEWLQRGIKAGFCSALYCSNHQTSAPEDNTLLEKQWEEYEGDHCWFVVRLK